MFNKYLIKKVVRVNNNKKRKFKIWSRYLCISKNLVGFRVFVYTGFKFIGLFIEDYMVGYRFGQFIFTKKLGSEIHQKKIKRRRK